MDTINGIGTTRFPPKRNDVNAVNPSKILLGRLLSMFPYKLMLVKLVRPEKSPDWSAVIPVERRFRLVIVARCVSVISAASVTFGTAATMASRTCVVRWLTGSDVEAMVVSLTSIMLMMTVIVSVSVPSETVIVTE